MRVYFDIPPGLSRAMHRVVNALAQTCAENGFERVDHEINAELVILHVIGFPETVEAVERLKAEGKKYGLIQYCMRTTQKPNTRDWLGLWGGAEIVWTYYDLPAMIAEDSVGLTVGINLYMSPLGGNSKVFRPWPVQKKAEIMTSGYVAESEGVKEAAEATRRVGGRMIHLGPESEIGYLGDHVGFMFNVNDGILSQGMARCKYVAALRRGEGFELPGVEGLLCGARPVCFDQPHYRKWYGDFAEYIPEGSPEEVTDALEKLFAGPYREVTTEEIKQAAELFNWQTITTGFWQALRLRVKTRPMAVVRKRKTLLWVGDAVVASGFARATHHILNRLKDEYDVKVLGINYHGDPHEYPYDIFPTVHYGAPSDMFGMKRLPSLAKQVNADVIVLQNDPWHIPGYVEGLKKESISSALVGAIAIDGKNCQGALNLNDLTMSVFWTDFALNEARDGGYQNPATVIPLGVDLEIYHPMDKELLRKRFMPKLPAGSFIVGNANRNQPRKRLDLTIRYFCRWVKEFDVENAFLYLHVAPTGDRGYDCGQLFDYYRRTLKHHGLEKRLFLAEPEMGYGVNEKTLAATYSLWDVQVSTTQGEGWGLTTLEGMACGVPQICPDWAALGEWAKPAVILVPCSSTAVTPNNINVVGGIADEDRFLNALNHVYSVPDLQGDMISKGLDLANQPQYRWSNIGERWAEVISMALNLR
jgi:D-inositol-3-phosphate glycosyltransferase